MNVVAGDAGRRWVMILRLDLRKVDGTARDEPMTANAKVVGVRNEWMLALIEIVRVGFARSVTRFA